MAWPPAIKTFTLTFGPGTSMVKGTDLGMEVDLTASTSAVWAATGTPLISLMESATAEPGMQGSVTLPNPDQDGFIDGAGNTVKNWTIRAAAKYTLGGRVVATASKVFTVTAADTTVDLDTLIPVTGTSGVVVAIPDSWSATVLEAQAAADEVNVGRLSVEQLKDTYVTPTTVGALVVPLVPPLVTEALATDPTISDAAVDAVHDAAAAGNLAPAETTDSDGFSVRYDDSDTPFITFRELDDTQGWQFAIIGNDDKLVLGQRLDGSWYPTALTPVTLTPIVRWGDSLTANSAGSATQLSTALGGRPVFTQGIGGQTSQQIAARNGGVPTRVTVTGGIIPASGTVGMTLTMKLRSDTTSAYPIVVAGVAGTFQATDSTAYLTGTFTRTTPGLPAVVPAGTPATAGHDSREYWPILWAGRNNFKNTGDNTQIVSDLQGMLDWSAQREHALIFSIPPWVGEEDGNGTAPRTTYRDKLDLANSSIRDAFPREYVDVSARLRNADVITATGHTPTTQDLADIANGLTPTIFRTGSDGVTVDDGHLGPVGYTALYTIIAEIYTSRGWSN